MFVGLILGVLLPLADEDRAVQWLSRYEAEVRPILQSPLPEMPRRRGRETQGRSRPGQPERHARGGRVWRAGDRARRSGLESADRRDRLGRHASECEQAADRQGAGDAPATGSRTAPRPTSSRCRARSTPRTADRLALKIFDLLDFRCVDCHGRHGTEGGLDLRTAAAAIAGGKSGAAVVPGKPDSSPLIIRLAKDEMPPRKGRFDLSIKPITEPELDLLRSWIAAGAPEFPKREILAEQADRRSLMPIATGGRSDHRGSPRCQR